MDKLFKVNDCDDSIAEITEWKIATPIVQTVTGHNAGFVSVGVNDKIGPH